ncbi:DEAD-box ATP-dependent RNA helicase 14 [Acorus calamus]|uniref:RNA helicase n=1 Tax=Acorus calamus TaxID=4465 RepID=A0AAV9EZD0_ACOCL|nr:DEAD-box ATP-dependent RNA helicase 14 [Acorus calamus]
MAMTTTANGPRYAPEDPTLPKPWKGLVDGSTGYLYFWNPVTNVTQYERPVAAQPAVLPPPPPPSNPPKPATVVASSVQVKHHHEEEHRRYDDGMKQSAEIGGRSHQNQSGRSGGHVVPNGVAHDGHGHGLQSSRFRGHGDVAGGTSVESYRHHHEITVSGDNVPPPFLTFESTGFPPEILREVHHAGFTAPTPIQAQSWPIALQGRDIVAIAKTGSGKTLGYLIPGFIHIKRVRNNSQMGPTVLVLSPTRELATQIQDEAVKFGRSSRISCTCLYGGAPKGPQLRDLERGADVVVATPGRLNDFLEMRKVSLRQVSYLVLDEADRMLDMGFEPQIRKIVKEIPPRRQTLMYTATWPKEVRKIAADLLIKPAQVNIGSIDELVANKAITQYVEVITPMEKQRRLEQILRSQDPGSKVIIFCSTKRMCDQLARSLTRQFGAAAIHGDKSQGERDYVLGQFRTGRSPILVATDVAARGLDIKDIRVVINYDFPTGVEDYVHRIGRTGRAGATGVSHTFFCDQDAKYAKDLIKVLEGANQRVPPEIRDMASRSGGFGRPRSRWGSGGGGFGGGGRDSGRSYGGGGRNGDSGYGGRGGGRSDRDYDRDREPLDRYEGRSFHDEIMSGRGRHDRGGYDRRSADKDRSRGRTRSRSRSRGRSRSRSANRYGLSTSTRQCSPPAVVNRNHSPRTNHKSPSPYQKPKSPYREDSARSPSLKRKRSRSPSKPVSDPPEQCWVSSPQGYGGDPKQNRVSPQDRGEEEEEGMIPPEEEGMIPAEDNRKSP